MSVSARRIAKRFGIGSGYRGWDIVWAPSRTIEPVGAGRLADRLGGYEPVNWGPAAAAVLSAGAMLLVGQAPEAQGVGRRENALRGCPHPSPLPTGLST